MPADEIDRIHAFYKCQVGLLRNLEKRAFTVGANDFFKEVEFPSYAHLSSDRIARDTAITQHLKQLRDWLEEWSFLSLMAAGEAALFKQIGTAAGEIKKTVDMHYIKGPSMARFRRGFVKDEGDIRNLGGLGHLLGSGPLGDSLKARLEEAIDYRDYLAHGKREGVKAVTIRNLPQPPTVDSTVKLLRELLALC